MAFELHALVQEANWGYQLFRNRDWFKRERTAVQGSLERARAGERDRLSAMLTANS